VMQQIHASNGGRGTLYVLSDLFLSAWSGGLHLGRSGYFSVYRAVRI